MNLIRVFLLHKKLILIAICALVFYRVNCEETTTEEVSDANSNDENEAKNEENPEIEATNETPTEENAAAIEAESSGTTEGVATNVLEATEGTAEESQEMNSGSTMETKVPTESIQRPPENTFAHYDSNREICLLARFKARFTITFPTKGADQNVSIELPERVSSKAKCGSDTKPADLQLSWGEFVFTMVFSKILREDDPDQWAVTGMSLRYDTSSPLFDGATSKEIKTARSKDIELFKTEYGMSYECSNDQVISLQTTKRKVVMVKMKDIKLQPFDVKDGKFSEAQRCMDVGSTEEPFVQDETVPLAVGLTLTILTLIIVVGFSIHRAYNMRKVDYNNME